jgi:uncharacterized LabA/DUF88 family protein
LPPLYPGYADPRAYFLDMNKLKANKSISHDEVANVSLPIKIAIFIDGGFFIKRYNHLYNKNKNKTPKDVADDIYTLAHHHVGRENYLYRIFYYDCPPFDKRVHNPIDKRCVVFGNTQEAKFRNDIFHFLRQKRKVALRLGYLKDSGNWQIRPGKVKELLSGKIKISDLSPDDVYYELRQKCIDMKIGVDIASISLKRFVDRIILVSGDADFVPASKLARREGIDFILDPMGAPVEKSLFEHIDGKKSPRLYLSKNT